MGVVHSKVSHIHSSFCRWGSHSASACGDDRDGQCEIPRAETGRDYVCDKPGKDLVLQLALLCEDGRIILTCSKLSGHEVFRFNADGTDLAWTAQKRIAGEMGVRLQNLQLILPAGRLLREFCHGNPKATIADVHGYSRHVT